MKLKEALRSGLRSVSGILPGTSVNWGPVRGGHLSLNELGQHPEIKWKQLYDEEKIPFCELSLSEAEKMELQLLSERDEWTNIIWPGYIGEIPGGRYYGCPQTVVTPSDDLSSEWHWPHIRRFESGDHPLQSMFRLPKLQRLPGTALVLGGYGNPYHLLFEAVPRLSYLKDLGITPHECDWFITAATENRAQQKVFEWFGVADGKRVPFEGHVAYRADNLIFAHTPFGIPRKLCCRIRSELGRFATVGAGRGKRRLYLLRGESVRTRRILNETELMSLLDKWRFEPVTMHDLPLEEQARLMADAECVISAHGAALANLIWCGPGTSVIELRRKDQFGGYWKLYWNIGSALDLDYHWLSCDGDTPSAHDNSRQYANIEVPIDKMEALLSEVCR